MAGFFAGGRNPGKLFNYTIPLTRFTDFGSDLEYYIEEVIIEEETIGEYIIWNGEKCFVKCHMLTAMSSNIEILRNGLKYNLRHFYWVVDAFRLFNTSYTR